MGIKKVTIIEAKDDLTGENIPEDTKATEITYGGKTHKVFMSEANVKRFEDFLNGDSPLVTQGGDGTNRHGYDVKDVRTWAISSNHKIDGKSLKAQGRVPQPWFDAYKAHMESEEA